MAGCGVPSPTLLGSRPILRPQRGRTAQPGVKPRDHRLKTITDPEGVPQEKRGFRGWARMLERTTRSIGTPLGSRPKRAPCVMLTPGFARTLRRARRKHLQPGIMARSLSWRDRAPRLHVDTCLLAFDHGDPDMYCGSGGRRATTAMPSVADHRIGRNPYPTGPLACSVSKRRVACAWPATGFTSLEWICCA